MASSNNIFRHRATRRSLNPLLLVGILLSAALLSGCGGQSSSGLSRIQKDDTGIARDFMLGGVKEVNGATEEALRLFTAAHAQAEKDGLFKELGEAKIKIGEVLYDRGSYDSALTWFVQARGLAMAHDLPQVMAYALYYIGKYNETKGAFGEATRCYDSSLAISRQGKDSTLLILALTSRGKNYISEGKLNLALQNYMEAFQLGEALKDSLLYAQTCSHLGSLYMLLEQYDKALDYSKKALTFRGDMNNPEGIAKSCNNVGIIYHKLKQPDSAFYYFYQALALCKNTHYQKGMVKAMSNIGSLYCEQNLEEKAARYLDTAYMISTRTGYGFGIASAGLNLASHFKKNGQLSKAIYYYRIALSKIANTDYDEMLENVYQGLFDCYDSLGDYRTALQYHILLLQTQKKLLSVENARQLAELNISFDLERKEKDYRVLQADNELKESLIKRNTTFIWLVVIALGFTIVLCLHIYNRLYAKKKAHRQLEALNRTVTEQNGALALLNTELEKANREKDKLFSIISHELRNPLYWFQNLSEVLSKKFREMPPEKVQKSLSALDESAKNSFHLMDNLLQWSRSKLNRIHPKKGEHDLRKLVADAADMYQTILRHKDIGFRNAIPDGVLIHADADLLSCVIRNLLSNAIKYTPASGNISVDLNLTEDLATVIVADSGTGIPHADVNSVFSDNIISMDGLMQEKGSGIGLKLCKDFVELNGGVIWVESIPDLWTKFFFTAPLAATPVGRHQAAVVV
jgi:signal transduction histidine kinase/Flp pilus assembly protein TadD